MKTQFRIIKLRELEKNKGDLVSGPFGSDISAKFFVEDGVPVIRGNNLKSGDKPFIDDGFVYITYQKAAKLIKCKAIKDDLIFTAVGTIGQVGIIPAKTKYEYYIISNKQIRLRVNTELADPYFVYYQLSTKSIRKYLEGQNRGSSVPLLNLAEIRNVTILLPPLPIQRKIASILSAYDELIENNKQRIKLLEEMAEEIYKEWFVRLRFPGYETAKFEDGLPEGWEFDRIKKFGKVVTGKTPSKNEESYYEGSIPFIKTPDMQQGLFFIHTEETLSEKGANSQPSQYIPKNSISVSCIGTVGKVGISTKQSQTNQQINSLIPTTKFHLEFLYFSLLRLKPIIESYAATGATMANLSKSKFENLKILKPSDRLISNFHEIINSSFEEIQILLEKNQLLQQTRDLLLPRLISGKLSVEHLVEGEIPKG